MGNRTGKYPRTIVLVVLGCDLDKKREQIGWQTEARCREAVYVQKMLMARGYNVEIVVSPGKAAPKKHPWQKETLAEMMRDFMVWTLGVDQLAITVRKSGDGKNIWGSKAELRIGFQGLRTAHRRADSYAKKEPLHVVTSWYHIPRVKMIAWITFRQSIVTHAAPGSTITALVEFAKLPIQFVVLLAQKKEYAVA